MTDTDILLVKRTWKVFRAIDPGLIGETFFSKLIMDHPELRTLFPKKMESYHSGFVELINSIVSKLGNDKTLEPELKSMAVRQSAVGIKNEYYLMIRDALLWTLRQGLGCDWNEDVSKAWGRCYEMVAEMLMEFGVKQTGTGFSDRMLN